MILVTGGTGLLGSHLLFDLTKQGLSVRAIKRTTSDVKMVRKIFSYYTDQTDASSQVDRYSNEKIKKSLDFEFIPIEQSIRDICGYFLKDQSNGSAQSDI